ncbi:MAG: LLM class flavin-dependent oxidoreductase [Acidobacteriota bacterium]|nr:LLM class flavin-dependent oxidoreductase [Acidobacteriota bacterium]
MSNALRFNMTLPGLDPADMSSRYRAALEMGQLADRAGMQSISIDEHHGSDDGWMPSPMLLAGMMAARTERIEIHLQALLLPLHDPLRVAEDLISLDLASGGRIKVTLGVGYRPSEYLAHGKDWERRGALMDSCVADLLAAWRGQPIDRGGATVHVTPRPLRTDPPFLIGGSSAASARRAARFGLALGPPAKLPDLEDRYRRLCAEFGVEAVVDSPPPVVSLLFVSEDPERAWHELGSYLLHEATTYASWQTADIQSSVHSYSFTASDLRAEGIYEILTPDEVLAKSEKLGEDVRWVLHPLCGGMPLDAAWECVHLFVDRVLARQGERGAEAAV